MSIDDISLPTIFDSSPEAEVTSVTAIPPVTFSLDSNTSGNSGDTPTQKPLPPEVVSGGESDLDRFKAVVAAQAAPTLSNDLGNDLTSLLKDLSSGNNSAAKGDITKVQADMQSQDATSGPGAQTESPLDTLIGKISDSLNAGGVPGAVQEGAQHDLANFLVENGKGTGSLINTSA